MALYAFDGTGNEDREGDDRDSNVLEFFRGYLDPRTRDAFGDKEGSIYLKGIGTRALTIFGETAAEAFGFGGHRRVREALDRLEDNLEAGDADIDIIGFSRGAALAMSFANEITAKLPRLPIRFLGVWDLVGQFGLPGRHLQAGHVLSLPGNVKKCFHAMALDESRAFFPLTRLCEKDGNHDDRLTELWFRGVHSDVGGGNGNACMNWISLNWMFVNAQRCGLPIDPAAVANNLVHKALKPQISKHKVDAEVLRTFFKSDCMHTSVSLDPAPTGFRHNNPTFVLRRIGDDGIVVEVAGT